MVRSILLSYMTLSRRCFEAFKVFKETLQRLEIVVASFDSGFWKDSFEIFAPIQASEAAAIHAGFFDHFEPAIAERLAWGAAIPEDELRPTAEPTWEFPQRLRSALRALRFSDPALCPGECARDRGRPFRCAEENLALHLAGEPGGNSGSRDSARRRRSTVGRSARRRCRAGCLRRVSGREAHALDFAFAPEIHC